MNLQEYFRGEYYVRFTYGDGTYGYQKIHTNTGQKDVTAYDYKSTRITNPTLQNLIKKDRKSQPYSSSEYYWYKETSILSSDNKYSIAVDVLGDREALNSQSSKEYNIRAYTPTFKIGLENEEDSTTGKSKDVNPYNIEHINFGIIDTPKISLGFEKVMTNIKVTNTQGNIIVDGNPAIVGQSMKYLSNLDSKKAHLTTGSDYAKIEIKDEEIYGSKLEITYVITIINDSDVNFYETDSGKYGYYYMFGDKAGASEVNITIEQVDDYLDKNLTLMGNDHRISNDDTYTSEGNILKIDGDWKKLYSQKAESTNVDENDDRIRTDEKPSKDKATIVVIKTLSNADSEMNFENYAMVANMKITGNPALVEDVNQHQVKKSKTLNTLKVTNNQVEVKYDNYFNYTKNDVTFANLSKYEGATATDYASVNSLTIVPPTGADMLTPVIYSVVTIIAGIIITIGIIVIKKKVI